MISDLDKFKEYLKDEQERLSKVTDDDFLKELLTQRCASYERLIKELEDEQQRPAVLC